MSVLDIHRAWSWFVIVGNALAGVWALVAHRWPMARTRLLWYFVALVQLALIAEVILGVVLVAGNDLVAPQFHMFYGFVGIIAIAIIYSYRGAPFMRDRAYLLYGLGSLFVMGLAIRAVTQS